MATVNSEKINTDEISLKDIIVKLRVLINYLKSKTLIILIACLTGGILGGCYAYFKKAVYVAELSFALDDNSSSGGGLGSALGLVSQFGVDLGGSAGGAFNGDNLMELMKSRSMVENTLLTTIDVNGQKQTLAELYISINRFRENWNKIPVLKGIRFLPESDRSKFTLQQDSILGVFYNTIDKTILTVDKLDKKIGIITVKVESKNELFSKLFTEELVKTVSDFYIDTKTKKSAQNVNILQRQTDSVRRELNLAITGVASTGDINPNPNPTLQIIKVPSLRRQVDVQANTAILTELVKDLELSKVSLRRETPLIQVIDRPILPLEKKKLGKLVGIVLGGFIATFLIVGILIFKKIINVVLK